MAKIPLPHYGYDRTPLELFGLSFTVQLQRDEHHEPPWESSDGHGVVTGWEPDDAGLDPNRYRVLHQDRHAARYYDWEKSTERATEEQWGLGDEDLQTFLAEFTQYTAETLPAHLRIQRAVQLDYEFLRSWCNDEWEYVGVIVQLEGTRIERSLWGIESNATQYLADTAAELAGEIVQEAYVELSAERGKLAELLKQVRKAEKLYRAEVAKRV